LVIYQESLHDARSTNFKILPRHEFCEEDRIYSLQLITWEWRRCHEILQFLHISHELTGSHCRVARIPVSNVGVSCFEVPSADRPGQNVVLPVTGRAREIMGFYLKNHPL